MLLKKPNAKHPSASINPVINQGSKVDLLVCIDLLNTLFVFILLSEREWIFLSKTGFPATRVHLTKSKFLDFEEPSTRCSFTSLSPLLLAEQRSRGEEF